MGFISIYKICYLDVIMCNAIGFIEENALLLLEKRVEMLIFASSIVYCERICAAEYFVSQI